MRELELTFMYIHTVYSLGFLLGKLSHTVYWVLFTGVKCSLFVAVTFQKWKLYNSKYLFYIGIYEKKITNSDIIAIKIDPDIGNNETFTQQIISYIEYHTAITGLWYPFSYDIDQIWLVNYKNIHQICPMSGCVCTVSTLIKMDVALTVLH